MFVKKRLCHLDDVSVNDGIDSMVCLTLSELVFRKHVYTSSSSDVPHSFSLTGDT